MIRRMDDIFRRALAFSLDCHANQVRKGPVAAPYACHPLAVAADAIALGGSGVAAAAALLHDVIEDCGVTRERLAALFGEDVAACVADVSYPAWARTRRERQRAYLGQLRLTPRAPSLIVACCDKTHNLRSTVMLALAPAEGTPAARESRQVHGYYAAVAEAVAAHPLAGAEASVRAAARLLQSTYEDASRTLGVDGAEAAERFRDWLERDAAGPRP
jgi:(p)ppGpp synthase/HD superfamily hydrolase